MTAPTSFERRVVTVLFADLVGFTPLTERLDAEDVAAVQDAYFAAVRETIRLLEAAGAATAGELDEAAAIETHLGLV
jgi:class 3 adenylate cyclase